MARSALLLLLIGCDPKPDPVADDTAVVDDSDADTDVDADSDTDADTDTDTVPDCDAVVTALVPADGAFDVALDTVVSATFSESVVGAYLAVDGLEGTMTLADDGLSATFVPDGGFSVGTGYSATAIVCGNPSSTAFTTIGEELPVDLTGRTYDVELDGEDLTWVAPALGAILAESLLTNSLLFMVQYADTSQLDLVGAAGFDMGRSVAQYPCAEAIDFRVAPYTEHPLFSVGPQDATLAADGVPIVIFDLAAEGVVDDDGEGVSDVVITGLLDTRAIAMALDIDVCGLASSLGDDCVACPDDGEIGCLAMELQDPSAPWREGVTVDPLLDPDVDPICN